MVGQDLIPSRSHVPTPGTSSAAVLHRLYVHGSTLRLHWPPAPRATKLASYIQLVALTYGLDRSIKEGRRLPAHSSVSCEDLMVLHSTRRSQERRASHRIRNAGVYTPPTSLSGQRTNLTQRKKLLSLYFSTYSSLTPSALSLPLNV